MAEVAGVNISSILSLYNYTFTGISRPDAFKSKCCRRTHSDGGSRMLPTTAHLVAVNTRALRRRGRRNSPRDASTPYGSRRLLMADFGHQRWACATDPSDLLLVVVAGCVSVVGRVVGTARWRHEGPPRGRVRYVFRPKT